MDNLVSLLKMPALNLEVKSNILRMVQNWNFAFEAKPMLGYVGQVYKTLLSEGAFLRPFWHKSWALRPPQVSSSHQRTLPSQMLSW